MLYRNKLSDRAATMIALETSRPLGQEADTPLKRIHLDFIHFISSIYIAPLQVGLLRGALGNRLGNSEAKNTCRFCHKRKQELVCDAYHARWISIGRSGNLE